ncbi:MAG: hypothetical protein MJK04_25060, partial [Psychrosphaera sp.]|nr:hypothetical protein [Psychrosphaera sp.]
MSFFKSLFSKNTVAQSNKAKDSAPQHKKLLFDEAQQKAEAAEDKALARQQEEFDNLKAALDDSSDKNRNFLLAFLLLEVYLFAATFSTTDAQLFLIDEQQTFSLFNFKIPMEGFFWIAPLVLFAFHFNVLFNLKEHSQKLYCWLNDPLQHGNKYHNLLRPYIFNVWAKNQLVPPKPSPFAFSLLKEIIILLFAIAPLALQVFVMWRLSDLQDLTLSHWHSVWVIFDVLLLAHYWPRILNPSKIQGRQGRIALLYSMSKHLFIMSYLFCALVIVGSRYYL